MSDEIFQSEETCADCKKRAALFTALGLAAGFTLGFFALKVVKRGR